MPIKSLIKETLSLQGFRVDSIDRYSFGLNIKIVPDRRYRPRCGKCGHTGKYRDTRPERQFKHVPLWGLPCFTKLLTAPCGMQALRWHLR